MAGPLRPVVGLMLLASLLLVADGLLDGAYPGGSAWLTPEVYHGLGWTPYAFAAVNLIAAILVARGSERSLVGRIGLSGFFLVERPLTAFLLGPKPSAAVAVHAATALVELVILLGGLRVWRLGRSFGDADLAAMFESKADPASAVAETAAPAPITARTSFAVGLLALCLSAVLIADGVRADYIPGGRLWGTTLESSGWIVYLFGVAVLSVAARAVRGGALMLRLLFVLAIALFVERAFSPFVLLPLSAEALALHALAAFAALSLALAAAAAVRRARIASLA